jgi:hypothetical protein
MRAQTQSVVGYVTLHIGKKILIRGDAEGGGPIFPFNYERPAGVDLGKGANRAFFGFDLTVTSNSHPSASNGQPNARSQKYKGNLLHGHMISLVTMQWTFVLDSKRSGRCRQFCLGFGCSVSGNIVAETRLSASRITSQSLT